MEHFASHKRIELCFALVARFEPDVKGIVRVPDVGYQLSIVFFSFDGEKFYDQANSTIDHHFTSLGNFEGSPFVVSGCCTVDALHKKTEFFDVVSDQWTELEDFPFNNL